MLPDHLLPRPVAVGDIVDRYMDAGWNDRSPHRIGRYLILRDTGEVKPLSVNVKINVPLVFFGFEVLILEACSDYDEQVNAKKTLRFAKEHMGRTWEIVYRAERPKEI
jgi:hypothetical protein